MTGKGCGHGKLFSERCIECALISAREGLKWATENVDRYSKQIAELEKEKSDGRTEPHNS